MNRAQIWIHATRPKTLVIGICPIIMGITVAAQQGIFNPLIFLFTILTALCIQIGTNLANDYFDSIKGADTSERKGFIRVTQAGLISPKKIKQITFLVFTAAALCGSYLIEQGGIPIAILLIISVALGILYTGGPFPLAYLGLGDFFAFLFFGPIAVLGTYYLQTGMFSIAPFLIGLSPGAFSMAFLTINNVRDIDEDRRANKKTLPVRWGKTFGKCQFIFCILLIFFPLLFFCEDHPFLLLTLLILLPAIPIIKMIVSYRDPRLLNQLFANFSQLQWLFTLLFCIGWVL